MHNIFDIACNFTSERFDNDLEVVIERAIQNNVTKFGLICSRISDIPKLMHIQKTFSESMSFTIGVHPHHANEVDENRSVLPNND